MIAWRTFFPLLGFSFCLLFLLASCGSGDQKLDRKQIVAEAHGDALSRSEMETRMPNSISPKDSKRVAETAIRNWVREKVLINKAEEELSQKQKDFRERIESYRRSLLIHSLEEKHVKEKLDTSIDEGEITAYYRKNKKEFILDEPILKSVYVQLKKDSIRYVSPLMRAMRKDSAARVKTLKPLCREHALDCNVEGENWMRLNEMLTLMPLDINEMERFLKKRSVQRFDQKERIFLIRNLDHRIRRDTAPLSFVQGKVRSMIINKRKRHIIDELHKNAILDARKNDKVKINQ